MSGKEVTESMHKHIQMDQKPWWGGKGKIKNQSSLRL
jgi:hypothetical protein